MDPSSLIFVVLIAIWAAYLLGHWVRRRDQLATARSIDRFSEAMRVLERRTPVAAVPSARAHVVAQRVPSRSSAPLAAQPVAAQAVRRPEQAPHARRSPARAAAVRRRAVLLAGLVGSAALGWLLVAAGVLTWVVPVLLTTLSVVLVGWLRVSARRAVVARRDASARASRADRASAAVARADRPSARAVAAGSRDERLAQSAQRASASVPAAAGARPAPVEPGDVEPGDVEPGDVEPADVRPAPAAVYAPGDLSWQPVPVPPPTYTLKGKAPTVVRPTAAPSPAAVGASHPGATIDLDEVLERRIASGA